MCNFFAFSLKGQLNPLTCYRKAILFSSTSLIINLIVCSQADKKTGTSCSSVVISWHRGTIILTYLSLHCFQVSSIFSIMLFFVVVQQYKMFDHEFLICIHFVFDSTLCVCVGGVCAQLFFKRTPTGILIWCSRAPTPTGGLLKRTFILCSKLTKG